jgi:branched-chain amino acid transport system ATP-binding protein
MKITGLEVTYGLVQAVKGVDLEVQQGGICTVLGVNGAGKSSIIKAILGLVKFRRGTIEFPAGNEIQGLPPHKINRAGIAWLPQGGQVFSTLTVYENLLMGAFGREKSQEAQACLERVMDRFPILRQRREQLAGSLSGGEQQMLAFGRALMSEPKLLILDEPSLGLAPRIVQDLFALVSTLRNEGLSILMTEQNAREALKIADYAYLLEVGEIRANGAAREIEASSEVQRVYLGT